MAQQPRPTSDAGEGAQQSLAPPEPALYHPVALVPFAYQHGNRLLILDAGARRWTLAELRFDPIACSYAEVRRAHYRWPREAAGALLGRVLAAGMPKAEETASGLARWLAATPRPDEVW